MMMKRIKNPKKLYLLKRLSKVWVFSRKKKRISFVLIRNYGLLSFGNEAEEDEEEITKISMVYKEFFFCFLISYFVEIQTKRKWKKCT